MQEVEIKGKTLVTAEIKAQIDDAPIATAPNYQNIENLQSSTESLSANESVMKDNTAIMKEFGNIMPELLKNFRTMNDIVTKTNQNLPSVRKTFTDEEKRKNQLDAYKTQGLMGVVNTGGNVVQSLANGNTSGAIISGVNGLQGGLNNLSKVAANEELAGVASGLAKAAVGAAIAGVVLKGVDTLANKYIEEMPTIFGTGKAFGTSSNIGSMNAWQEINKYNKGTGLSIDEFQGLAQSLRKQGLGNGLSQEQQLNFIGNVAQATSKWAYATGGDANQYAQLAGLMGRYGGSKDVASDFSYLVAAGKSSGLEDTQIPEFLSGIQKVMEDGIAKGFSRSATDVADTLLMMSKLSNGNEFWKGEKGAARINQLNAGIASATALNKTEDMLIYAATRRAYSDDAMRKKLNKQGTYVDNGGYVNVMQMIEKGITTENFDDIMEIINQSYGSEPQRIEALRKMTGLNYQGAAGLYNMGKDPEKVKNLTNKQLENYLKNPENQNKETQYQQAMNDIKAAVVGIGETLSDLKIPALTGIGKDVLGIYSFLTKENKDKIEGQRIYDSLNEDEKKYYDTNAKSFANLSQKNEKNVLAKLKGSNGYGRILANDITFTEEKHYDRFGNAGQGLARAIGKDGGSVLTKGTKDYERAENFYKGQFASTILGNLTNFDYEKSNKFVEWVLTSNLKNVQSFRQDVYKATKDRDLSATDEKDITMWLKAIYNLFTKEGITVETSR